VFDETLGYTSFDVEFVDMPIFSSGGNGQVGMMARQWRRIEIKVQQRLNDQTVGLSAKEMNRSQTC
jgi:hypothetical protein